MIKYCVRSLWNVNWGICFLSNGEDIYKWLVKLIAQEYKRENYPVQFLMPSVRKLSNYLRVKRYLVERAYEYWIKRKEILYALDRVGTFMFKHVAAMPEVTVARHAQFSFNQQPLSNSAEGEGQLMNILTLGNSYQNPRFKGMKLWPKSSAGKVISLPKPRLTWFSDEALRLLRERKLINNEQQLCVIPDGKAVYKILKTITRPEDVLVITSINDAQVVETAGQLRLNLAFSGADDKGMSAVQLEEICRQQTVKVVLVRPEPDFPVPVRMDITRWEALVRLSEIYGFCILVLDEDAEFRSTKCPSVPISLKSGNVIYLSPFSKLSPILHKISIVAGPEDFIASLIQTVKKVVFAWDSSMEKALLGVSSKSKISIQLKKSNQCCKTGAFNLQMLFRNYLEDFATLLYPGCGTFAVLKFNAPLNGLLISRYLDHPLYQEGENFGFEPKQPIDAIRFSLFIEDWISVEFSLKTMLKSLERK